MTDRAKFDEDFWELVTGWTLVDDFDELTDRIEAVANLMKARGVKLEALDERQRATVKLMIETQVMRGIDNGDFMPFIPPGTEVRIADAIPDGDQLKTFDLTIRRGIDGEN